MNPAVDPVLGEHVEDDVRLVSGQRLPQATTAYVTLGRLNDTASNAVLITHGYTSSHRFILPDPGAAEGSWAGLVGPGRAIDSDRFYVIAANALGSSWGSTGPGSLDPATGVSWGEGFPSIRFADIVARQAALVTALGVERLHAVAGVSMGGFQALQWGVQYPDRVDRLIVALSALDGGVIRPTGRDALGEALRGSPDWNGGRPVAGALGTVLTDLRRDTLRRYGLDAWLEDQGLDEPERLLRITELASEWAARFHPMSLLVLRDAIDHFDVNDQLAAIRARLLLVLSTTDALFPASSGPAMLARLRAAGVDARFVELQSRYGHLASGLDADRWAGSLRDFLRS